MSIRMTLVVLGMIGFAGAARAEVLPADLTADIAAACSKAVPSGKHAGCVRGVQSYFRDLELRVRICRDHASPISDDQVLCKGTYADALLRSVRGQDSSARIELITSDLVLRVRNRSGEAVLDFLPSAAQYLRVSKVTARKYSCVLEK